MLSNNNPWWLPGALLVLFGVTIVIFPELLAWMVASAFIFIGALMLWAGWASRKAARDGRNLYVRQWRMW